ncbi:putative uncharacterized protein MYH16 [Physella acuta]|uniref:putative uncharacterized protein MYH16 n=1 Tax=Physella acuta TaxID=109671 RepID=UPI0027DD92D7|nr:putative uncharacterized protein MYH16 [Physella acuta]
MTSLITESDLSFEPRTDSTLAPENEIFHYRQRFQSMKLVLKELQNQIAIYKNRCSGVDTVALMLKESKQEVVKLTRQCKALDTAVANLQNRLAANGLSSSVNIEENEMFVPGASKQTLDNLARENARLRNLLKNTEVQAGKKLTDDFHSSKQANELLEDENIQLKAKMEELEKLLREKQDLEEKLNEYKFISNKNKNEEIKISIGCQTSDMNQSKIEELRKALKTISQQCLVLDSDLESIYSYSLSVDSTPCKEKSPGIDENTYLELESRLNQVVLMNQRWQAHSDNQEQQVHLLGARIAELEQLTQDSEMLRTELEALKQENQRLKRDVENLTRELHQRRSQPQYDASMVEILKQQIQVCTEDFNTERKDREQAVNRAKQLSDEVNRLINENENLKKDLEMLKSLKNPLETPYDKRDTLGLRSNVYPPPTFKVRGSAIPATRLPQHLFSTYSSTGTSPSQSISPVTSPVPMSFSSASNASSSYLLQNPHESSLAYPPRGPTQRSPMSRSESDFLSLPRSPRGSTAESSQSSVGQFSENISMPQQASKKGTVPKTSGEYLTCPKCGKEFESAELVSHIDICAD